MPDRVRRGIRGVLTDIDDTLTTDGKLTAEAYAALRTVARGRQDRHSRHRPPGGLVRPHRADVAGGCRRRRERRVLHASTTSPQRKLVRRFVAPDAARAAQRARIAAIGERIVAEVPGSALASDQQYRETDLAIDYCEDVPALPRCGRRSHRRAHAGGGHDGQGELDPRQRLVRRLRQARDDAHADARGVCDAISMPSAKRFVFAGDSPNDAPMFGFFPNAVGVANVRGFLDRIADAARVHHAA